MTDVIHHAPLTALHLAPVDGSAPRHFDAGHGLALTIGLRSQDDPDAPPCVAALSIDTHPPGFDDTGESPLGPALDTLRKVFALGPCRLDGWVTTTDGTTWHKVTVPRVDWSQTAVLYAELVTMDESLVDDAPPVVRLSLQRGDTRPAVDGRYFTVGPDAGPPPAAAMAREALT
ncbi:hypothetical protein [Streptomyces sp. NPDC052179]|uniref:hypothetical protein n=1 Tax=Streptomyces sp. NPDC052179 TaxID=3155680 RepID=UPI0034275320